MEVRDGVAAVFREAGAVVKIRQVCRVGDTVNLPEPPRESARNAWQKVSALGAKLSELPSRLKHETGTPVEEPIPDTTEIISDTVRETLDARTPVTPDDATTVISDTVRETLDARDTEAEIMPDAQPTTKVTFDAPPATKITLDKPPAPEGTFEAPPAAFGEPPAPEAVDATESMPDPPAKMRPPSRPAPSGTSPTPPPTCPASFPIPSTPPSGTESPGKRRCFPPGSMCWTPSKSA